MLAAQAQGIEITVENHTAEVASKIEELAQRIARNGHT